MKNEKRAILATNLIGLAVLGLMLNLTSPAEVGPFGVLVFFTTIYALVFSWFYLLARAFLKLAFSRHKLKRKEWLEVAVAAFLPLMLLMARSFGELNFGTVGLAGGIFLVAEFLVVKMVQ